MQLVKKMAIAQRGEVIKTLDALSDEFEVELRLERRRLPDSLGTRYVVVYESGALVRDVVIRRKHNGPVVVLVDGGIWPRPADAGESEDRENNG